MYYTLLSLLSLSPLVLGVLHSALKIGKRFNFWMYKTLILNFWLMLTSVHFVEFWFDSWRIFIFYLKIDLLVKLVKNYSSQNSIYNNINVILSPALIYIKENIASLLEIYHRFFPLYKKRITKLLTYFILRYFSNYKIL